VEKVGGKGPSSLTMVSLRGKKSFGGERRWVVGSLGRGDVTVSHRGGKNKGLVAPLFEGEGKGRSRSLICPVKQRKGLTPIKKGRPSFVRS